MPAALPLLLAMLTSAPPAAFSIELVPPPLPGPVAASVRLLYKATRELPFLTSSFEWDLMGRRVYFEPDKKWVEVPLQVQGGVLRADGLEREAGGLARWTLDAFEVKYGRYSFCYARSSLPNGLPVWEHRPRLDVFVSGQNSLEEGTTLLRIMPAGPGPAPGVDGAAIRPVPGKTSPGGDEGKDQGGDVTDPTKQQGWRAYKAAWELAGNAMSEAALQELLVQTPRRWSELDALIDERLQDDLEMLVRIRAANRRMALNPGRGDRVATDPAGELLDSMEHLERTCRVVLRLRTLRWQDPWIEQVLAADAAFLVQVVGDQADQVERRAGRATDLVLKARDMLARAGSILLRPPR
jgi:hypothetical protein